MNISKHTVLLVDDHSIVRKGIYLLIKKYFGDPTIFEVASINEAVSIVKNNTVKYIILDINFPVGNSLTFVEYLRSINSDYIKILIFSALDENIYAFKYIRAGANGFLSKLTEEHQLVFALRRFFENGKYLSEYLKDRLLENMMKNKSVNQLEALSVRELEIARLFAQGHSNTFERIPSNKAFKFFALGVLPAIFPAFIFHCAVDIFWLVEISVRLPEMVIRK